MKALHMLVSLHKGYETVIAKPVEFAKVATGLLRPQSPQVGQGQIAVQAQATLTAPSGFTTHLVRAGESLWTIWHQVSPPKASWAETQTVNSKILKNTSVLYPGDYVLAPVSECVLPL